MNLCVGMYPSLMGSFNLPPPSQMSLVFAISQIANENESRVVPFRTHYSNDSWTLPNPKFSTQGEGFMGMESPLSVVNITYLELTTGEGQDLSEREEIDQFNSPAWLLNSPKNVDSIDLVLPSDEAIMEAMTETEKPQGDLHQRSYSLLNLDNMQGIEHDLNNSVGYGWYQIPISTHDVLAEGNMANSSKTIPINISKTPGVIENVLTGVDCSQEKIETYIALFKEFCNVFS